MFLKKYEGIFLLGAINTRNYKPNYPVYTKLLGKESTWNKAHKNLIFN